MVNRKSKFARYSRPRTSALNSLRSCAHRKTVSAPESKPRTSNGLPHRWELKNWRRAPPDGAIRPANSESLALWSRNFMKIEPYLFFDGRCEEAIEFYRK